MSQLEKVEGRDEVGGADERDISDVLGGILGFEMLDALVEFVEGVADIAEILDAVGHKLIEEDATGAAVMFFDEVMDVDGIDGMEDDFVEVERNFENAIEGAGAGLDIDQLILAGRKDGHAPKTVGSGLQ